MTLLGLVELSQTPTRAVRGLVLSVFASPRPRPCAKLGVAEINATMRAAAVRKRVFGRIKCSSWKTGWNPAQHSSKGLRPSPVLDSDRPGSTAPEDPDRIDPRRAKRRCDGRDCGD